MKKSVVSVVLCLGFIAAGGWVFAAKTDAKSCQFSDVGKLKEHVGKHISYPAKGKAIKQACKKEMPDEFTKAERACVEKKIKNNVEYKSSADVLKALGVE